MKEDRVFQERRARIDELRAANEKMTCRERVLTSLKHQEPDRVPIDNWMVPEIRDKTMEYYGCESYEELLRFLGVDFRNNYGPSYVGQSFKKHEDGTVEDLWGVKRKTVIYGKGNRPPGELHRGGRIAPRKAQKGGDRSLRPLGQPRLVGLLPGQGRMPGLSSGILRHQRGRPAGSNSPTETHDVPEGNPAKPSWTW